MTTEEKIEAVIEAVAEGMSTTTACDLYETSRKVFYSHVEKNEEIGNRYARAVAIRTELDVESIEEEYNKPPLLDPESGRIDSAWVALQRLKIDSKKWLAAKRLPKKYGDKLDIDHTTQGEKIIFTPLNLDVKE